jgi:AcrR family transcriptional regulator
MSAGDTRRGKLPSVFYRLTPSGTGNVFEHRLHARAARMPRDLFTLARGSLAAPFGERPALTRTNGRSISFPMPAAATRALPTEPGEDLRRARGERRRQAILSVAVDLASTHGLEGLSVGLLASRLRMSKSGLFAHFGSMEGLQLAVIEAARDVFIQAVVRPALAAPRGLPRLWAMVDNWLAYAQRKVFRGGCFFAQVSMEFDGRPGPIRDRVAAVMREWISTLRVAVEKAVAERHLARGTEADLLAFELHALSMEANWSFQLFGDPAAFALARAAVVARLRAAATRTAPKLPPPASRPS